MLAEHGHILGVSRVAGGHGYEDDGGAHAWGHIFRC